MKTVLTLTSLILTCLLLLAVPASAQIQASILAGIGVQIQGDNKDLAWAAGIHAPIFTADGFQSAIRTVYFYTDPDEGGEIQATELWDINRKTLMKIKGVTPWSVSIGFGIQNQVEEGEDTKSFALKLETDLIFPMGVGIGIGVNLIPVAGAPDKKFVYVGFSLSP